MKLPENSKKKLTYQPPRLVKYGSLTDMTASSGTATMADSVGMGGMKT